ncbi:helix-turn-helix transcriptional regulator [Endozoicomonadaceae bacterium StTr2]
MLERFFPVAEAISILLHPHAEVVVHNLKTQKVVALYNNFSQREIGSPSLMDSIEVDDDMQVVGPYEKLNWDGRKLKSISSILRDENSNPVGMLCINLDVSQMEQALQTLSSFLRPQDLQPQSDNLFRDDWFEKINVFINRWLSTHGKTLQTLTRQDKQELIKELYLSGAFNGPKTAEYTAKVIGLGRTTVFNYLKQLKG